MTENGATNTDNLSDFFTEVLLIGGGFGGMYALHRFQKLGIPVTLVEAGSGLGGTWHHNRYPGARRFPDRVELRRYFNHPAEVLDLYKNSMFNTVVEGITWDETTKNWTCCSKAGQIITCKYLVLCTGSSYKKHLPRFKDLEKFKGLLLRSAAFDYGEDFDFANKKVAVVGNGATGVQILQELGRREDCNLTAFIRTPIIALLMKQRSLSKTEQKSLKSCYDSLLVSAKQCKAGFPYHRPDKSFAESTGEEKRAHLESLWERGGFSFFLSNYFEFIKDRKAEKTRARVSNPAKRDVVAPLKQENLFGIKRPSLEQDYYEVVNRTNVSLVNLKKIPVQEITEDGILTSDGELRTFDIIILATGYDAMTGSLMDLGIRDRNGIPLQELWRGGVETYLGLMIAGMPNIFMVYSPQAPTALSNGPTVIQVQVDSITNTITKMKACKVETVEPKKEFAQKWRQDIQDMNSKTLYPAENSWYMGANIPGKIHEQLMYIGGVDNYNAAINDALSGWKGFDVNSA